MENFILCIGLFVLSFIGAVALFALCYYMVCLVFAGIEKLTTKKTKTDQVDCKLCEYSKRAYCGYSYPQEKIEALVRSGERYYLKNSVAFSNENPYIRFICFGRCEFFALCSEHGTILYLSEILVDVILCCMSLQYAPTKDGKKVKK